MYRPANGTKRPSRGGFAKMLFLLIVISGAFVEKISFLGAGVNVVFTPARSSTATLKVAPPA